MNNITILLAEDNPGDVRLTREALKESKIKNSLYVVGDGQEAIDFLLKKGQYLYAPTPDIIFLDINMPKKNGMEALKEIKNNHDICHIPICMLTTSDAELDVVKAYQLHANCYVTKPVNMAQFINVVKAIDNFWFTIVRLPPEPEDMT